MNAPAKAKALDETTAAEPSIQALDRPATPEGRASKAPSEVGPLGVPMTVIPPDHKPVVKAWAIYVFMRPDNALELAAWNDIREMTLAGTGADAHVIVQLEQANDRHRLSIADGVVSALADPPTHRSTPFDDLGDFIQWAATNYPGDQKLLIVWGHSRGVGIDLVGPRAEVPGMDPASPVRPTIGPSHASPHPDALTFQNLLKIGALFKGLAAAGSGPVRPGPALDLLGLDSCYMSSVEFAHALTGDVGRLVASQSYMKLSGWNYATILGFLRRTPKATPAELADAIVAHVDELADGTTLAHLDLDQAQPLADAFRKLVDALRKEAIDPVKADVLGILAKRVAYLKVRQFLDLRDLCHKLRDYFGGKIGDAAVEVLAAYKKLVVRARANGRAAGLLNGVSLYYDGVSASRPFGNAAEDVDAVVDLDAYGQLPFVKETGWQALVTAIERAGSDVVEPVPASKPGPRPA
jgi:hypothetical protein